MTNHLPEQGDRGWIPEAPDLADRMRKTLRVTGIGVAEIANSLQVTRETVGTWINGRITPRRPALMAWASVTGCDLEWLETGQVPEEPSTLVRSYLTVAPALAEIVDLDTYRAERAA